MPMSSDEIRLQNIFGLTASSTKSKVSIKRLTLCLFFQLIFVLRLGGTTVELPRQYVSSCWAALYHPSNSFRIGIMFFPSFVVACIDKALRSQVLSFTLSNFVV